MLNTSKLNYIDLFSGIGGFALGLQQAGIKFDNHYFAEIDLNAINIYKKHFPEAKELGDVQTIRDVSGLKADIISFGFPCQDLSLAGKRRGLAGARSGLFFEALRIIRELKPSYFIFENVSGLLTSDGGADFIRCLREIADLGLYECEWQLVNTNWILPQRRERIYFVGHLGGTPGQKIFPLKTEKTGYYQFAKSNPRIYADGQPLLIPENTKKGYIEVYPGQGFDLTHKNSKTRRGRLMDGCCNTLTTEPYGLLWYDGRNIRNYTPLEGERLQGYPDGWTEYGADGRKIPDRARYKAIGNAVSVIFPKLIGEAIKRLIDE